MTVLNRISSRVRSLCKKEVAADDLQMVSLVDGPGLKERPPSRSFSQRPVQLLSIGIAGPNVQSAHTHTYTCTDLAGISIGEAR